MKLYTVCFRMYFSHLNLYLAYLFSDYDWDFLFWSKGLRKIGRVRLNMVVGGMKAIRGIKPSYFIAWEDGFFNLVIEERPNLQPRIVANVRSYQYPQQRAVCSPSRGRELLYVDCLCCLCWPIVKTEFFKNRFINNYLNKIPVKYWLHRP